MTIFDLVTASNITAYWSETPEENPPFFAESLFPDMKKLGLDLKWIKGKSGSVQVMNLSAFDSKVVPRDRIGFDVLKANMPFFKESLLVDEELRQELNKVLETNNMAYIESIMGRIFNDEATLLSAARNQRERMRMQLLTSGTIALQSNGLLYSYDYGLTADQKPTAATSWSDPTADILGDIEDWQDDIEASSGTRPTRAVVDRTTFGYMRQNNAIKNSLYVIAQTGASVSVSESLLKTYLEAEYGLQISVYSKRFVDEKGVSQPFMPADTFVMFPEGTLGNTWFGTTPEESDLLSSSVANVSVTDTGVAVTTMKQSDPVNVETKVSQIVLPSFEQADKVLIADVIA